MLDKDAMVQAMMMVIAPNGIPLTDQAKVDENVKDLLGTFNINPEDTFAVGNMILAGAVAAGEEPEHTVVQAYVVGVAVGAQLARMDGGNAG